MNTLFAVGETTPPIIPPNTNTTTPPKTSNPPKTNSPSSPKTSNMPSNSGQTETVLPQIKDPFGGKTLSGVVSQAVTILLTLTVILAVVVIIVSGFQMIAGGGNPDQVAKAKKAIIWAIIGIVVAFMSFVVVQIIQSLL